MPEAAYWRVSMRPWPFSTVVFRRQLRLGRGVEIAGDLAFQDRRVAFQPQKIIGAARDDLVGDGDLAAHGVDGDQRAVELFGLGELIEQIRDGGDLVGLFGNRELGQGQARIGGIDSALFARCFASFTAALWPERHDLIAIDGKTARRTLDKRKGLKALHTLSA